MSRMPLGFKVEVLMARAQRLMDAEQQKDPARLAAQVRVVRAAAAAALKKCKTLKITCTHDPLSSRPCHRNRNR